MTSQEPLLSGYSVETMLYKTSSLYFIALASLDEHIEGQHLVKAIEFDRIAVISPLSSSDMCGNRGTAIIYVGHQNGFVTALYRGMYGYRGTVQAERYRSIHRFHSIGFLCGNRIINPSFPKFTIMRIIGSCLSLQ